MAKERCDTCRFWLYRDGQPDGPKDDAIGLCRRSPPQFLSSALHLIVTEQKAEHDNNPDTKYAFDMIEAVFDKDGALDMVYWAQPTTSGCGWCGEYQPKSGPPRPTP